MRYYCILCCLCLPIMALFVSFETRAAPFCFTAPHIEQKSQLTPGAGSSVVVAVGPSLQSIRLLHLRMPVGEGETRRAREVVNVSLSAQGITLWGHFDAVDRYHRKLGHLVDHHVWLQKAWVGTGTFRVLPGMVSFKGLGGEDFLVGELACLGELFRAEMDAVQGRRGLWSDAENKILAAHDLSVLEKHVAEFVLVEGRVRAVGQGGGRHFINFGDDWRLDFTVVVPQPVLTDWPKDLHHPQFLQGRVLSSLVGQQVRVRGWLTSYRGPEIIVEDLSQIEILGLEASPLKGRAEGLP